MLTVYPKRVRMRYQLTENGRGLECWFLRAGTVWMEGRTGGKTSALAPGQMSLFEYMCRTSNRYLHDGS
jgi:hypothetical protein